MASPPMLSVRDGLEDYVSDQKLWVSSKNRVVKTEGLHGGARFTTEYDFSHAVLPANAIPMGGK